MADLKLKSKSNKMRKGDEFLGYCWKCGSVCLCERLPNGHDKDTAIYTDIAKARPLAEAMVKHG